MLQHAPVGEVVFRPSSKGANHLTATIKLGAKAPPLHHSDFLTLNLTLALTLTQVLRRHSITSIFSSKTSLRRQRLASRSS